MSGDVCATDADCAPDGGVCEGPDKFAAIEVCGERDVEPCTNEVGSNCCGLTQGAYGAPNSIATAACSGDCIGCGFIPAAQCNDCDPFFGDPNGTTAGIHETHAVSLDNLQTLIAYLPSGGTAGCFNAPSHPKAPVGPDTHYSSASEIPDLNKSGTNSNGQGGGVLAGQEHALRLRSLRL